MVSHDFANVGNVGVVNYARTVEVLQTEHTWECRLSIGTWEALVRIAGASDGG